jgi:type I restriction enzyme M protein
MKKCADSPAEPNTLEKMLSEFAYRNGFEMSQVFDSWLEYIIVFFSIENKPIENWKYKPEHNKFFYELMTEWIRLMEKQVECKGWYDAFGAMYESLIAGTSRRSGRGQFFTPSNVCDLMAQFHVNSEDMKGRGRRVGDPTCGSGRNLLAFHSHAPGNYVYGEDIDRTCCMMTVCNFLIHGCVGEVVWHDSIMPDSWYHGWEVNRRLNNPFSKYFGLPHVSELSQEDSFSSRVWESKRLEIEKKEAAGIERKKVITISKPTQLSLFD